MKNVNDELRRAAEYGDKVRLKVLLRDSACDPMSKNQAGQTALMRAAARGHVDCVEILLPVSDALMKARAGGTALMRAAFQGSLLCVQLLATASNIRDQDANGLTALMWAAAC